MADDQIFVPIRQKCGIADPRVNLLKAFFLTGQQVEAGESLLLTGFFLFETESGDFCGSGNEFKFFEITVPEFTDVETDSWYEDAVNYAVRNDILSGTSAEMFSPALNFSDRVEARPSLSFSVNILCRARPDAPVSRQPVLPH